MVVKVYVSGISGNKEVKKRQQRVLMILDSKHIKYDVIDITEPGKESDKEFMQNNSKSNGGTVSDPNPRSPLPPQLFNDEEYCGDYDLFDLANEVDTLEQFLKLEVPPEQPEPTESEKETTLNGDVSKASKENSQERESTETDKPDEEGALNVKETSPIKEGTPSREGTDKVASKEATPARDDAEKPAKEDGAKEADPEKEPSPARQKSVEKEGTPAKEESPAKEIEEDKVVSEKAQADNESINENGTISSRDQSVEKDAAGDAENVERKKEPSELLIESEQAATAE